MAKRSGRIGYLAFTDAPPAALPRLVVVAGKAHALADDVVRLLVAAALPDEPSRALNLDVVDAGSGASLTGVHGKVRALPFLAERRVIVVRGTIDLKKEGREAVAAACADVPEHALLIVDHAGKPVHPQGRKPMDEAAEFAKQTAGSLLVDCTLDAQECGAYIERYAKGLHLSVDPAARDALASTQDVAEIKNVLDRLSLTTKRVREQDVRAYALSADEAKLWDIGDAVNKGDAETGLRLARALVRSPGDAVGPLVWLAGDSQILWELSTGTSFEAYARATGQSSWRARKLSWIAASLGPAAARERVDITMRALERSLTGRRQADQALEEVIVRLCARRKK